MAHKTRESPCDAHGTLGGDAGGWSVVVETGIELMRACLCSVGKSSECGHAWQRGDSRTTAPRRPPRAWHLHQSHALCRLEKLRQRFVPLFCLHLGREGQSGGEGYRSRIKKLTTPFGGGIGEWSGGGLTVSLGV